MTEEKNESYLERKIKFWKRVKKVTGGLALIAGITAFGAGIVNVVYPPSLPKTPSLEEYVSLKDLRENVVSGLSDRGVKVEGYYRYYRYNPIQDLDVPKNLPEFCHYAREIEKNRQEDVVTLNSVFENVESRIANIEKVTDNARAIQKYHARRLFFRWLLPVSATIFTASAILGMIASLRTYKIRS